MPDLTKPAMELLQDIDLAAAQRIQPQHLEILIDALRKSNVSKVPSPSLRTSKIPPDPRRIEDFIRIRSRSVAERPMPVPEFDVEQTSEVFMLSGAQDAFDLNRMFTVADKVLGPFPTHDGIGIFYNFYKYIDDFKVFFPGDTKAALIIPVRLMRILAVNPKVSALTLIKGNLWIRADLLDPVAPSNTYIGMRILSGTVNLGGAYLLGSNSVVVQKNTILDLDINLDNSFKPEDTLPVGVDGKHSEFKPTEELRLKSNGSRLLVSGTQRFGVKTLGWECNFSSGDPTFDWDQEKKYMCLTLMPSQATLSVVKSESDLYKLEGTAKLAKSQWMLQSRVLINNQSVEVKFNGVLSLNLLKGIQATWDGLKDQDVEVKINTGLLMVYNGFLYLFSEVADYSYLRDHLTLWQKSAENPAKMELEVRFASYKTLQILSQSDLADSVGAFADTEFLIDKPLRADNTPVHPKSKQSFYTKLLTKEGKSVMIIDSDMMSDDLPSTQLFTTQVNTKLRKYQFALENAYFTTTKESGLFFKGKYDDTNHVYEATLRLNFYILNLLPTLPHPYTTNRLSSRGERDQITGNLQVITTLKTEDGFTGAEVTFQMNHQFSDAENQNYTLSNPRLGMRGMPPFTNSFMLFDVSTESDHWGVALSLQERGQMTKLYSDDINVTGENVVTINRNYLQAPMGFLRGLTLPQVSWEPVNNITPKQKPINPGDPPIPDPELGILNQIPNFIPTVFSQMDNHLVRIHPMDYLRRFKMNLKSASGISNQNLEGKILFTLPNGKYSYATIYPYKNETMYNKDHLEFIMPDFKHQSQKYKGGQQFRIAAYKDSAPDAPPRMEGTTQQLYAIQNQPGISILGETVTTIFNNVFAPVKPRGVPITHIDFSGYGASTFSNWKNPTVKFASISQTKFDLLKGRTGHEIVQAVSVIYPWGICVTRTVTFLRNNNAVIFREDSGWVAQSEGLFDFSFKWPTLPLPFDNPYDIYPGLVEGLFNVKNIREDYTDIVAGEYTTVVGDYYYDGITVNKNAPGHKVPYEFVAVYFDCNVDLNATDENITGRKFKGYLQTKPEGVPVPARILKDILHKSQNPVSGSIDAIIPVEKTLQKFKTNAVEMTASYQNDNLALPAFVASVKGSAILPADGSWSVVDVDRQSGSVQNLKTGTSVGLIKDGLRPKTNGNPFTLSSTKTLMAYPDSLKNTAATFNKTYGLLQNTDTQKLLLKGIEYTKGEIDKYTSEPALLADCFHLMNSKGPFPNLTDAIQIDGLAKTTMNLLPEGVKKVFNYKAPTDFTFDIVGKLHDAFRIYLKYTAINTDGANTNESVIDYVTDSDSLEKWANQMHNITIAVDLAGFEPLMYISGNFSNEKKKNAGMEIGTGPQLKLDKTLQTIYDILEFLNNLDPTQPSEAIKKALKIAMSNSSDSWEYKFKADKEIPLVKFPFDPINYNSPTTPLKMDAFFRVGVYFNQPIKIPKTIDQIKPSVGAYLELGADLRVMCVSVAAATIYAIGRAEVGLAADLALPPSLYFKFGFGIELAVGLPVIGSVAVTFMVGIDIKISGDVIVGAFIYFRGRAEILGGIVTITISIEAAGQVQKKIGGGPTNCIARCTFALDISIAFVINISFTETWEETRQIS